MRLIDYYGVTLEVGDTDLADQMVARGEYLNPFFNSACRQYVKPGDVVLDIGANAGVLTVTAAKRFQAKVFAFEPSPREQTRIARHAELNGVTQQVDLCRFALGSEDREIAFALSAERNTGQNRVADGDLLVAQRRLDGVIDGVTAAHVRVAKLDVEGYELEVLRGASGIWPALMRSVFILEMSPALLKDYGATVEDLRDLFARSGFVSTPYEGALGQWEEVFHHPLHNAPPVFNP